MQLKMPGIYITVINNSIENLKIIVIYHFYTALYIAHSIANNFSDTYEHIFIYLLNIIHSGTSSE